MPRDINDILLFREDISPFLVHLTRNFPDIQAAQALRQIIQQRQLCARTPEVSDARFGMNTMNMTPELKLRYFGAVCLTETPINEIHCLLEITGRQVDLQPCGLVFLKNRLQQRGVSPVNYVNNETGNGDRIVRALTTLIAADELAAAMLLPLISVFGRQLTPPGAAQRVQSVDFRWEREWRFPNCFGALAFDAQDIFIGICPHNEIGNFEAALPGIGFIDPARNMKWYASKLIASRQRLNLRHSVV